MMLKDIYEGKMPENQYVEKTFAAVTKENVAEFGLRKKKWLNLKIKIMTADFSFA